MRWILILGILISVKSYGQTEINLDDYDPNRKLLELVDSLVYTVLGFKESNHTPESNLIMKDPFMDYSQISNPEPLIYINGVLLSGKEELKNLYLKEVKEMSYLDKNMSSALFGIMGTNGALAIILRKRSANKFLE